MATLDDLKGALRQESTKIKPSLKKPLSDIQYKSGFEILVQGLGWTTYQDFILPQLSQLLALLLNSRSNLSALEIGPGQKSVFAYLPVRLRQNIRRYAAYEPNDLFATNLEEWLSSTTEMGSPLPCLESPPNIYSDLFVLDSNIGSGIGPNTSNSDEKFDIILFCHSMYGMKPKHRFIERALEMLVRQPEGGMVVVFHRDRTLLLDGFTCHRTASFPDGVTSVENNDQALNSFASFIAGFTIQDIETCKAIQAEWRRVCRTMGRHEKSHPDHLLFSSPNVMAAFTRHATMLPELTAQVPMVEGHKRVKNSEACLHRPASVLRPTKVQHIQQCIRWARKHGVGLTVIGGGHSGHCLWPHVVSIDMSAFDQVYILKDNETDRAVDYGPLVVAETGCTTGDIVRRTMAAGLTVPLGARPSVGAGLWLQGGIGHLARLYGLACDAIVGAVVVSVESSQVLCVGHVPSQYQPADAIRPANEADILWAIKGAGTNFGIVVSVTFNVFTAPTFLIRNWFVPLSDNLQARVMLSDFNENVALKLPRNCSTDAYLYLNANQLYLGVTMFESSTQGFTFETPTPTSTLVDTVLGSGDDFKAVDSVGLYETELYMSRMHGGHGGGKTSSFKRCLFLKNISEVNVANILVTAVKNSSSPLCYLHLLQGGGAVGDMAADATAFGCRDWDFACVITGVWHRDQDETEVARAAVRWVYDVARSLLPFSRGSYAADLGPDPRDASLAVKAFGTNLPRLAHLKCSLDPYNVMAYACPLLQMPMKQKLIILITGESCAGKDFCADIWVSLFNTCTHKSITARAVSISDAIKAEYAVVTGADLNRLLQDRGYKEQHRPALTRFFQDQVRQRPQLPEEHFLNIVRSAVDVDVLLITGMRDEAPVTSLWHLVPDRRLLDIHIQASEKTRWTRRGHHDGNNNDGHDNNINEERNSSRSNLIVLDYRPSFILNNNTTGDQTAKVFLEQHLLPFFHEDLQRLADMVRPVHNFPRLGLEFRHVLDISQQPGGLALCISLIQTHFTGDWAKVDAVVCCEAGGFVYASALAAKVDIPLALIREAGKLPPPTISVIKPQSHVSSLVLNSSREMRIEMGREVISKGASVVVVDDVLATGNTLCAVLQLLIKAGTNTEDICVMVVVEFPIHRGRALLRRHGFGNVNIQSLLVFGGD